jgi:RNA polymerase sigma factor (sigma-70 family)
MLPANFPGEIVHSGETGGVARDMQRLVPAAAGGCQDAWNEIVKRYAGRVWAVARAYRLSAADAADVSQTTWLRLLEHLPRLTAPERVGAWLATTARRECLRVVRRTGREWPDDEIADVPAPAADLDHELVIAERDAALWQAFARLRPRDQALLRLLAEDPAPGYAEISEALEMPIGSIGPTRVRALERLRREIAALGPLAHALS